MLKDDPEGVRKRAKEDINSFFLSSHQPSISIVKPASRPVQTESPQYIDLTDLVEPPPLVTNCSYGMLSLSSMLYFLLMTLSPSLSSLSIG
jgi:hypothetical protein